MTYQELSHPDDLLEMQKEFEALREKYFKTLVRWDSGQKMDEIILEIESMIKWSEERINEGD